MKNIVQIHLTRSAVDSIRKGHPWLYREHAVNHPPGEVVSLVDPKGRPCAWGLSDKGRIAVRVLGLGPVPNDWQSMMAERIRRSDQVRIRLVPARTDAYRVLNGPGDGTPGLVLDRYGELGVLRLYSACWEPHLEWIIATLKDLPWVGSLYRRYGVKSVDGRDGGDLVYGQSLPEVVVVEEEGIKMLVRPRVGQKTGLFLDQRTHRGLIRQIASGRLVANLFAYTGGFSVAAALGGASRVHTVDIAPAAIADAQENFRLNGLDPTQHSFETADAFEWEHKGVLDLLIVDPPSLARSEDATKNARLAYRKLHRNHGVKVSRDGLLATSSCTARVSWESWSQSVTEGLTKGQWSWIWQSRSPMDHPVALAHSEGHYLKFALLRRYA